MPHEVLKPSASLASGVSGFDSSDWMRIHRPVWLLMAVQCEDRVQADVSEANGSSKLRAQREYEDWG
jgi:hypothetical protein